MRLERRTGQGPATPQAARLVVVVQTADYGNSLNADFAASESLESAALELEIGEAGASGEALASLRRAGDGDASVTIDPIVIASAARRSDVVFTSDVDDLRRFSRFFPNVRMGARVQARIFRLQLSITA
jgi:hypothetical protein